MTEEREPAHGRTDLGLGAIQTWFQAVISHPDGAAAGVSSDEAQRIARLGRDEIERIVRRSSALSAEERIGIYAHAYYARLLEVLADGYPSVRRLLGDEVFDAFAFEYLQRYPSSSYTLDRLGLRFADFLAETRPEDAGPAPAWPEALVDLARLEAAIAQVFDGPGLEGTAGFDAGAIERLGPDGLAAARLDLAPSLRLLDFRFPIDALYARVRAAAEDDEIALPAPEPTWLALCRREYVVRRVPLAAWQHALLSALARGSAVGAALACAAERADVGEEAFAEAVRASFTAWTAAGFFRGLAQA